MVRSVSRPTRLLALGLLALCLTPLLALAQEAPVEQYRLSSSYNIGLRVGPAARIVAAASAGAVAPPGVELALPSSGGAPPSLPPESVFRIVSAVSWPGVTMTRAETPRKATISRMLRRARERAARRRAGSAGRL